LAKGENIEIIDVADGPLAKGIVPLENIFDLYDTYKGKISEKSVTRLLNSTLEPRNPQN
jgi:hypothetical protein